MKIVFLGISEAFDENYPNNSSLIFSEKTVLMVDCGDSAVRQLWKFSKGNHNLVDALYITHRHSDHLLGLPPLLSMMMEEGRKNPLTIICSAKLKKDVENITQYAYQGLASNFGYDINFIEIKDGDNIDFRDLKLSFGLTRHSTENIAIRISDGKSSICHSGDGAMCLREEFYKDLDFLNQETYLYDVEVLGHCSMLKAIEIAEKQNVKCLAMTHLKRAFRRNEFLKIRDKIKSNKVKIIIPEPLDEYEF